MSIDTFVTEKKSKAKAPKAAIVERWNKRVVPRGLQNLGKAGASAYLDSYGKGISANKVTELAICAESMGSPEMAAGFWEAAYNLETGETATVSSNGSTGPAAAPVSAPANRPQAPKLEGIPEDLQPGRIITMQSSDPKEPQSHFILNSAYLGQPKRDGHRNVIFATEDQTAHQSRSTSALPPLHPGFEAALQAAARECGPFILDGERYYRSVTGSEHRTAAQAATANINAGKGEIQPIPVFACFKALFSKGKNLKNSNEEQRIEAAQYPVAIIASHLPEDGPKIEMLTTAFTTAEKQALADRQKQEKREGEVWTRIDTPYMEDKQHQAAFRTKYMKEDNFRINSITKSKSKGRSLASVEVMNENDKCMGSVGTGFDEATGLKIIKDHEANPGSVRIKVRYQGLTENGSLWHPRMLELL